MSPLHEGDFGKVLWFKSLEFFGDANKRDTKIFCSFSKTPGNNGCFYFNKNSRRIV